MHLQRNRVVLQILQDRSRVQHLHTLDLKDSTKNLFLGTHGYSIHWSNTQPVKHHQSPTTDWWQLWLWVASPLPVVWCGSGVGFGGSPPSPPVAWYGLGGSPCMFGSAWGVWQTHASRPWGHDLCDSCRFGAIGIGLQWVNRHRDRACQGTWST